MKQSNKISVIIPVLNEKSCLRELLVQLQAIRSLGHELIVVDGGSTDGSQECLHAVVDNEASLIDIMLETSSGRALQMNAGASLANGSLLWFLHADTILNDELIEELTRIAEAHSSPIKSHAEIWGWFNIRLSGRAISLRLIERMMNIRSRTSGIATGDQGMFVAKSLFERAGGFPEIALMEDIALSKVLRKISRAVRPKNKLISSSRRWELNGIWKTVFLMWRLRLAFAFGVDPLKLSQLYKNHK